MVSYSECHCINKILSGHLVVVRSIYLGRSSAATIVPAKEMITVRSVWIWDAKKEVEVEETEWDSESSIFDVRQCANVCQPLHLQQLQQPVRI